jgi:hypothetical protein
MHSTANTFKTFVLLAGLGGLMVAIGSRFGRGGAILGLGLGLAMVGFSYWNDTLAIRSARAVPADEAQMPEYSRMDVQPAQATKYIVNPLTGRRVSFAKLFLTHPPTAERVARLRSR